MSDDEMEARSIVYNCARIVRLASGRFALFAPWSNGEGMPLVEIGTINEIESYIPSAEECAEWVDSITPVHESATSQINLAAVLGIEKPVVKIGRRL